MNILVTGPDGVLGNNLVRELLQRNYNITALTEAGKESPTLDGLPIQKISGNILDASALQEVTKDMDIVIHCAANTSMFPPRSPIVNKVNIEGTENVVNACIANGVKRLIYVGTANSFASGDLNNPGTETNQYGAAHYGLDYMDSKYKAQLYVLGKVKNQEIDAVVVNPTFMIGPYDSRPSSGEMILGVYHKKIPGYSLGGKNFVAVKDVAVGIANAISMGRSGECYILGHENLTYKLAFEKIAKTINVKPPSIKLTAFVVRTYGKLNSILGTLFKFKPAVTHELTILSSETHYYSSQKAITELQLPQTPIEIAVKDCFDWFKENDYLKK